jgi:Holliday junction resolvasome RuvABC ATP-dependent DNA helicase subunit
VGIETLAATINEEAITIEDVYKPYLLQREPDQNAERALCHETRI